ncbi:LexA family protein [Pantoea agglomerans]|uniref:LexA family protein n=1 Tax=Enterobacter agglomerans TaxID=549 RepID=UPI002413168D|nr:LexA family transcriptional regulator [Pantoea agglomerans]
MVQSEKVRHDFSQRLALACKQAGLDEHGKGVIIARALRVTSKAVSKWLNAESMPRHDAMQALAKFLKVDPVWLQLGVSSEGSNVTYVGPHKPKGRYPLISWVRAGEWSEAVEPYTLQDIDEWFDSDIHIEGAGFWLRVQGDSMTSPAGISVPEGMIVLVDTGREAKNGSLVIAKMTDANESTFKKLVIDGGQRYLKALNPLYPVMPIDGNCRIIGVVVEAKIRFC